MRTAIFDLDGTLADTAPDLIGAANEALAEAGRSPGLTVAAHRVIAGMGGKALIRKGLSQLGRAAEPAEVEALFPRFLTLYEARIDRESRLFDGAAAAAASLRASGWALGVCTNKPERLARLLLHRLGVGELFAALVGADTLPVRKPDPAPVWEAVGRAGGARDRAALIGDSVTDRDAARAAGAACVIAAFGYADRPVAELAADAVFTDFADLGPVLEALVA